MPLLSKPSSAAHLSLGYITIGAIMDVAFGTTYVYLRNHPPANDAAFYWCTGLILVGLILMIIGFSLGQIGRAARHAELPPKETVETEKRAEIAAAERAPMIAPMNPGTPAVGADGRAVALQQNTVAPPMNTAPVANQVRRN